MNQIVINGDNIELLKNYPDNYFDAVVTDPPYGLGKEPNAAELMKDWVEHGYHEISGKGFMGKEWDAFVPQPIFWKEVFRVLKHGGHVVAFYGTRTYDWGVMSMRFAGFEVRDCIQWLYGCLSDDTEILTKSGYIQYHKFIKLPNFEQQEIMIYDFENDIYKWEKPKRWNQYNIDKDRCYRIKSNYTDQIVSRNHRCLVERKGELVFIEAEFLNEMELMPTLSDDFSFLSKGQQKILQSSMQWSLSGARVEGSCIQGEVSLVRGNEGELQNISNGGKESSLEGWNNISQKERVLFGSETEICEMPNRIQRNGEEGWLCSGVSFNNGEANREVSIENGMRTSYRPQSNEQRYNESNVICNEQRPQEIRGGRSYRADLATITPIEYSGVIFCPTVSTGAFVARRNGKSFVTGNSGFPKSHNISKALDKMEGAEREVLGKTITGGIKRARPDNAEGFSNPYTSGQTMVDITAPSTEAAKQWDGWGTALKPANEPIVLARKPLEKGLSIAENILKWGVGGINIDASRIGSENRPLLERENQYRPENFNIPSGSKYIGETNQGRFPANVVFSHHPDCQHKGTKKVKGSKDGIRKASSEFGQNSGWNNHENKDTIRKGTANEDGKEEVENWDCHEDCPIRILDEQSGVVNGQIGMSQKSSSNKIYGKFDSNGNKGINDGIKDKGGASRFFYVAKASKSERNKGLDGFEEVPSKTMNERKADTSGESNNTTGQIPALNKNFHPTVKPIKLMQYLVKMITPPNGIVLDPFCGSGTTGVACKLDGFQFVGLEQDPEYAKIAEARINNYVEEKEIKKAKEDKVEKIEQIPLF